MNPPGKIGYRRSHRARWTGQVDGQGVKSLSGMANGYHPFRSAAISEAVDQEALGKIECCGVGQQLVVVRGPGLSITSQLVLDVGDKTSLPCLRNTRSGRIGTRRRSAR